MAIPSYTGTPLTTQEPGEYWAYIDALVGVVARTKPMVQMFLYDLKTALSAGDGYPPGAIDSDGRIKLEKFSSAFKSNYPEAYASGIVIYGMPLSTPVYYGWVEGTRTLAFGTYAYRYIYGEDYVNNLPAPTIEIIDAGPYTFPDVDGLCIFGKVPFTASFLGTYISKDYEESNISNIITIGPFCGWTTVDLAMVANTVPDSAIFIRYYRHFPITYLPSNANTSDLWTALSDKSMGLFRLVSEIKL